MDDVGSMTHILKITVPDEIYDSLKKHNVLDQASSFAIDGLINGILTKINVDIYKRKV